MGIKISENLRMLRMRERYSMEDIAEIIGVSRQSVAKWESGETFPDIEKCLKLAKLYQVSLDVLVSESLEELEASSGKDGKYCFGISKVYEGGKIIIPEEALRVFDINIGDSVLLLGDAKKGMAVVKCYGVY